MVQNRNSSYSSKNRLSKYKYHSNSDQLLDYVKDTQGSWAKKQFKNSKLSMAEAMIKETKLNYVYLTKKEKIDKKQAKKNRKEYWEKVEYDCY